LLFVPALATTRPFMMLLMLRACITLHHNKSEIISYFMPTRCLATARSLNVLKCVPFSRKNALAVMQALLVPRDGAKNAKPVW
jgi:hypothetical protein